MRFWCATIVLIVICSTGYAESDPRLNLLYELGLERFDSSEFLDDREYYYNNSLFWLGVCNARVGDYNKSSTAFVYFSGAMAKEEPGLVPIMRLALSNVLLLSESLSKAENAYRTILNERENEARRGLAIALSMQKRNDDFEEVRKMIFNEKSVRQDVVVVMFCSIVLDDRKLFLEAAEALGRFSLGGNEVVEKVLLAAGWRKFNVEEKLGDGILMIRSIIESESDMKLLQRGTILRYNIEGKARYEMSLEERIGIPCVDIEQVIGWGHTAVAKP